MCNSRQPAHDSSPCAAPSATLLRPKGALASEASGASFVGARTMTKRSPGIPYQFRKAIENGTGSKPLQRWASLGHPNSLRLETKARKSSSLVEVQNKSPLLPEENRCVVKIVPHTCDRTTCPHCRRRIGTQIKYSLEDRLRELQNEHNTKGSVRMWTLTLDRSRYLDPQDAHETVNRAETIRRMASKAGWKYWVCVVEWHQDGWPHYHLILWEPKSRPTRQEHSEIQRLWGRGWVKYSDRPDKKPAAAIRYLTDYITKTEKAPIPDWLLDSNNVRLIRSSQAWGPTRSRKSHKRPTLYTRDAVAAREENRTNREAQATCGDSCNLIETILDTTTGELKNNYLAKVPIAWRHMKRFIRRTDPESHARMTTFSIQTYDDNPTYQKLIRLINRVRFA